MNLHVDRAQWLKTYRETSEILETIRTREIAALTDQEALRCIRALVVAEKPWRQRPDWSGLVEQQALFHRRDKP